MNKYEQFACGQFLSDWPEAWTFEQVISELNDGDYGFMVTIWCPFETTCNKDIAGFILDLLDNLQSQFKEI